MKNKTGWKPLPISLKILSVIFILWIIGSIFAVPQRYELGLPFFGTFIFGISASIVIILLDIVAPIIFLNGLCKRKAWAIPFAFSYISIFIANSIIAIFLFREELGLMAITIPAIFNIIFFIVIYMNRSYFK